MIKGDVLKKLNIENVCMKRRGQETIIPVSVCALYSQYWYVLSAESLFDSMDLSLLFENNLITLSVLCEPIEYENIQCYKVVFTNELPEELHRHITEYLSLENRLERRKEERYDVGIKSQAWKAFGFKNPLQKVYLDKHYVMDCAIVNVSVHGALIIAQKSSLIPRESVITLCMAFKDPQETILEKALVVSMDCPAPKLFKYSLNLVSPGIAWKERIAHYIDFLYLNEN